VLSVPVITQGDCVTGIVPATHRALALPSSKLYSSFSGIIKLWWTLNADSLVGAVAEATTITTRGVGMEVSCAPQVIMVTWYTDTIVKMTMKPTEGRNGADSKSLATSNFARSCFPSRK
jgi:hypothetical protein